MNGQSRKLHRGIAWPLILLGTLGLLSVAHAQEVVYQGSEFCSQCHPRIYNEFVKSGHPYKLVPADDAKVRPIPLPAGYTWDDITYVIGGYKWKSRYVDTNGYIITVTDQDYDDSFPFADLDYETDGVNQWNYLTRTWSNYHAGEVEKPYDCGRCHTTNWVADDDWESDGDLSDNQDGLPGMHGTFAFGGIQCEQCHGPFVEGELHSASMVVDTSSAACGACHIRGDENTIPASGGFIRHHEQYNEVLASPHAALDCVECHDPHKQSPSSIKPEGECSFCHADVAESYAGTAMDDWNVSCEDCHMPMATKSALAQGLYKGDVMTHLFRINTDRGASLFDETGGLVLLDGDGQAKVTMDFACLSCHQTETLAWAELYARNFHGSDPPPQAGLFRRFLRFRGIFH